MGKRKCKRIIKVSLENRRRLGKMFECSERMVMKALCYESQTLLARRIQHTAREEMGGWIEAAVPEDTIFYDTHEGGERFMRQYFANGAVLEISLSTGDGKISFKGEPRYSCEEVLVSDIPTLQNYARDLR